MLNAPRYRRPGCAIRAQSIWRRPLIAAQRGSGFHHLYSLPRNVSPVPPEFPIQSPECKTDERRSGDEFIGSIALAIVIGLATLMPDKTLSIRLKTASLRCAQERRRRCNRTAVVFDTNIPLLLSRSIRHSTFVSLTASVIRPRLIGLQDGDNRRRGNRK